MGGDRNTDVHEQVSNTNSKVKEARSVAPYDHEVGNARDERGRKREDESEHEPRPSFTSMFNKGMGEVFQDNGCHSCRAAFLLA